VSGLQKEDIAVGSGEIRPVYVYGTPPRPPKYKLDITGRRGFRSGDNKGDGAYILTLSPRSLTFG